MLLSSAAVVLVLLLVTMRGEGFTLSAIHSLYHPLERDLLLLTYVQQGRRRRTSILGQRSESLCDPAEMWVWVIFFFFFFFIIIIIIIIVEGQQSMMGV